MLMSYSISSLEKYSQAAAVAAEGDLDMISFDDSKENLGWNSCSDNIGTEPYRVLNNLDFETSP